MNLVVYGESFCRAYATPNGKGNPGHEEFLISTSSDLHDVHAGLPELIGELLPHEEVKQLPGLGHHHLVACHIVQRLEVFNMNKMAKYTRSNRSNTR